jgi:colanic acid/amylovoran biosynthesis glycosyltransferase
MERYKINMSSANLNKEVVAHSVEKWLGVTMTWIYTQIKSVDSFSHIILCGKIINLDQFPWDQVHAYNSTMQELTIKGVRKFGLRIYPKSYEEAIEKHTPVLLHSHFGYRGWYDIPLSQKYNLKHVVTYYGSDVSMYPHQSNVWKGRYRELFQHADLFLCEGPHMAKSLVALGCPEEKVKVHRLGIDLEKIPFIPRNFSPGDEIRILIASSFREKKGIPYALKAIAKLKIKYSKLRVTIIGDSSGWKPTEIEKRKILAVIKEENLDSIVTLMGYQPYQVLLDEAYRHHIFLSPSVTASDGDTEGGAPVTLIEMAASGMPVVSTLHCDIPEVFDKNATNLLAKERSVDDLVDRLEWLIYHSDNWAELLFANRQHIEKKFDSRFQAVQLTKIYRSLLLKNY